MRTQQQGAVLFAGILVLIATLVIIQLWLLTAGLEALLAHEYDVLTPAAIASGVLLAMNAALLRSVIAFDRGTR